MKKWRCPVCGYIYEGENPPEACPLCKKPGKDFIEIKEEAKVYAAEHVVGVAAGVDPEIVAGLRANFEGECTEVGMYLAMARVADREDRAARRVLDEGHVVRQLVRAAPVADARPVGIAHQARERCEEDL